MFMSVMKTNGVVRAYQGGEHECAGNARITCFRCYVDVANKFI